MKVTVEARWGKDFPRDAIGKPNFVKEVTAQIRQRLQLREQDKVIVKLS